MKGSHHLLLGLPIVVLLLVITWLYFTSYTGLAMLFSVFFLVGTIAPDADMKKGRAKIYHSPFRAIAYLLKVVEFNTKGKRKHRGSLHKFHGVFLSSFFIGIIMYLLLVTINHFSNFFSMNSIFIFSSDIFLGLFLGQLYHLLEDKLHDKFGVAGILLMIAIVVFVYFVISFVSKLIFLII